MQLQGRTEQGIHEPRSQKSSGVFSEHRLNERAVDVNVLNFQLKAFNPIFKRWGRLPQELLSDDLKPPAYTGSVLRELATLSCKDVHYERCQELLQEAVTARLNGMNLNGDQLARPNKTNAATHLIVTDIRSVIDFLDSENTYVRSISQEEMSNYETSTTEEERRADVQQTGMMTRYKKKRATREVVINFFEDESRPDRTPAIGERHCGVQEAEDSDGELEGRPKSAIKRQKLLDEGRVESVTQHRWFTYILILAKSRLTMGHQMKKERNMFIRRFLVHRVIYSLNPHRLEGVVVTGTRFLRKKIIPSLLCSIVQLTFRACAKNVFLPAW